MNTVTQSLTKVCHYSLLGFLTFSSCSCTSGIQRRSAELWSLSVLYNSANVAHSGLMVCWQNTRLPPLGKWKAVPFSKYFCTPQLHTWRLSSPQLPQPCIRPGDATGWRHVCLSLQQTADRVLQITDTSGFIKTWVFSLQMTLWGGICSIPVSIYLIQNTPGIKTEFKHLQKKFSTKDVPVSFGFRDLSDLDINT